MPTVAQIISRRARRYGVDPAAALAVARQEGGLKWGAVGDQGSSYGPFQLHRGGALPHGRDAAWANSPQGIDYAIRMMAKNARGLTGRAAVESIVRNFERPADPASEIARAQGAYGSSGGGGDAGFNLPDLAGGLGGGGDTGFDLPDFAGNLHGGKHKGGKIPGFDLLSAPTFGRPDAGMPNTGGPVMGLQHVGKEIVLPTAWKGTHVTDGLADKGFTHAEDIMGSPGTPVGAPEAGTVLYFHPTGAQGGGSMMIRAASGRTYWLGHIAGGVPAGTRVTRGQVVASISGDHPRPHVHIDYSTSY